MKIKLAFVFYFKGDDRVKFLNKYCEYYFTDASADPQEGESTAARELAANLSGKCDREALEQGRDESHSRTCR